MESGIPIMVGIRLQKDGKEKKDARGSGHAVVCIGHGELNDIKEIDSEKIGDFTITNSADLISSYVYMDDNKYPFYKNKFDDFDYSKTKTKIKYFIVPLYKRVFLDAFEAEKTFYEIMKNSILGLNNIKKNGLPFSH